MRGERASPLVTGGGERGLTGEGDLDKRLGDGDFDLLGEREREWERLGERDLLERRGER